MSNNNNNNNNEEELEIYENKFFGFQFKHSKNCKIEGRDAPGNEQGNTHMILFDSPKLPPCQAVGCPGFMILIEELPPSQLLDVDQYAKVGITLILRGFGIEQNNVKIVHAEINGVDARFATFEVPIYAIGITLATKITFMIYGGWAYVIRCTALDEKTLQSINTEADKILKSWKFTKKEISNINSSTFRSYYNKKHGFHILHPLDWKIKDGEKRKKLASNENNNDESNYEQTGSSSDRIVDFEYIDEEDEEQRLEARVVAETLPSTMNSSQYFDTYKWQLEKQMVINVQQKKFKREECECRKISYTYNGRRVWRLFVIRENVAYTVTCISNEAKPFGIKGLDEENVFDTIIDSFSFISEEKALQASEYTIFDNYVLGFRVSFLKKFKAGSSVQGGWEIIDETDAEYNSNKEKYGDPPQFHAVCITFPSEDANQINIDDLAVNLNDMHKTRGKEYTIIKESSDNLFGCKARTTEATGYFVIDDGQLKVSKVKQHKITRIIFRSPILYIFETTSHVDLFEHTLARFEPVFESLKLFTPNYTNQNNFNL
eukprot:TRINITY_DN1383_c1_g2_i1.p1 TRINITY_DN1383_c1_g2~~TRINITY_DN1383_c1_g2_i1.p1  ORF type:complete len:547 (+),score=204.76 TRINITY_DN1383_c1_g2_i1:52-1692(+)